MPYGINMTIIAMYFFFNLFFFCFIYRAQSVRRTSLRDKTLTTKKDAVEETRLRLQAQEVRECVHLFFFMIIC